MRQLCAAALLCAAMWSLPANPIAAQAPEDPASPSEALTKLRDGGQPLSENAIRDLIARLDDAEVRRLLLERLDAAAREAPPQDNLGGMMMHSTTHAERLRENLNSMLAAAPLLPEAVSQAIDRLRSGRPPYVLLLIALGFAAMLAAGAAAEWGLRRSLRSFLRRSAPDSAVDLPERLGSLLLRSAADIFGLAIFVAAALLVFFTLSHGNPVTRTVVMIYLGAIIAVRVFGVVSRFLLAPALPNLRLLHVPDSDARFLHRQNLVIAAIAAFGFLTCTLLRELGLPENPYRLLSFCVGSVLVATVAYTIWRARRAISGDLAWDSERTGRAREVFALAWPLTTMVFTVLLFLFSVVVTLTGGSASYPVGLATLLAVIILPHVDAILERAARRLEVRRESLDSMAGQVRIVTLRAVRILVVVAAALFLAQMWGIGLVSMMAEDSLSARLGKALAHIGLTALVAFVLWELARIAIERRLAAEGGGGEVGHAEPGEEGGQGASRIRTLLPLLRVAAQVTIVTMAVMVVLSALGVDIGPLLAGAGVVGLAVGFGAQTLVRDIVSGVFFLVDDAFRMGEYIDVGAAKGTVEKISIRSLRLRHHRGALNTVPFGEITHLTNFSRDWAIMKLEFRVPFDTDLEKVRLIFKRIGKQLMQDPEVASDFLEPFKSQGVLQTDDSAFIIRGKFMSKPNRQFLIRRMVFQAVQKAFAEEGIHFADRRVTVHVPEAEHMQPGQRAAVERAAASAVAAAEAQAAKS